MHQLAALTRRLAPAAPVLLRLIFGGMMLAHGLQKFQAGPPQFARFLDSLGLPAAMPLAWVVTLLELGGGALLIVGLFSRAVAALLAVELALAIYLVTFDAGLIAAPGEGPGWERDLAYIGGFLAIVMLGPGRPSLDHLLGIEDAPAHERARVPATTGI